MALTKTEALRIFLKQTHIADACGVTRGAVSLWPEVLSQRLGDVVIGAAVRTNTPIPEDILRRFRGLEQAPEPVNTRPGA